VTAPGGRGAVGPAEARHGHRRRPRGRRALPANRGISCAAPNRPCRVSFIPELDGALVHQQSAHGPKAVAPEPDPQERRRDVAPAPVPARAAAAWRPPPSVTTALGGAHEPCRALAVMHGSRPYTGRAVGGPGAGSWTAVTVRAARQPGVTSPSARLMGWSRRVIHR
jgi:hypothetical protein